MLTLLSYGYIALSADTVCCVLFVLVVKVSSVPFDCIELIFFWAARYICLAVASRRVISREVFMDAIAGNDTAIRITSTAIAPSNSIIVKPQEDLFVR